ncbi:hypothetical protein [Winogradskyella rapida]|uniref:Uncharacterized protein n=1 Tax=Winogradskyella rapida TaxID=549701 RepID=A0ABW3KQN5_9FLAO
MKKIFDKLDSFTFLILSMLSVFLIAIFLNMVSGISSVKPWHFGILYLAVILIIYYSLKTEYNGIKTFLSLLLFAFMVYPISSYYLYQYDNNNYEISKDLIILESLIAKDRLHKNIPVNDLIKIREAIKKSDVDDPKSISLPFPYKMEHKNIYSINNSRSQVTFTKNDSLETEIIYNNLPPLSGTKNYQLIDGINGKINLNNKLLEISLLKNYQIPFSEFWIESVVSFSSGHIKPAKNFPKIFNSLQIVSLLFLSTILINSVNGQLTVAKKKKRKKKRKK